jgi:transposase-like protein
MERETLKRALLELSQSDRALLIKEIEQVNTQHDMAIQSRRVKLDNKHGRCPYCGSFKYNKFGTDKGSRRYRCKECKRTFTEYTGTWLSKLHKKELTGEYIKLMSQEKSLDKIKVELGINKKTAFDWRHKILSGIENSEKGSANFEEFTNKSLDNSQAWASFKAIPVEFEKLMHISTHN